MSAPQTHRISISADGQRVVTIDQIVNELSRVWADISTEVEQQTGEIPIRTSILTLIIIARGESQIRVAHETLHELVEQLPSRVIVVEVSPEDSAFDASVAGHCRLHSGPRTPCYEVIELHTPPDRIKAVPSLLAQLELSGIPSAMWWVGQIDFEADEFKRLAATADRVIIDSSRFDSALDTFASFDSFLRHNDSLCSGTDLAWARIVRWREAIAQAFDHPETIELLPAIEAIEIGFDSTAEAQALLLLGWLASRLKWSLDSAQREGSTLHIRARNASGGPIDVHLLRQSSTGVGLRSIRILAREKERNARISVRVRAENILVTSVEWPGVPRQDRVDRLPAPRLSDLIGQELLVRSHDEQYHDALAFVVTVVAELGRSHEPAS